MYSIDLPIAVDGDGSATKILPNHIFQGGAFSELQKWLCQADLREKHWLTA